MTLDNRNDPLKRVCRLCGYPLGKHVAPPYGTIPASEIGNMGLLCPPDVRVTKPGNQEAV